MISITMNLKVVVTFLSLLAVGQTDLSYNDPDIDDGPCSNPAITTVPNLEIFNPLSLLYVPAASKMLYRQEYTGITNQNAQTEADVLSIKTRARAGKLAGILNKLSLMTVSFFGTEERYYNLQLRPNVPNLAGGLASTITPNFTAKFMPGSPGSAPVGYGGDIGLSIIWNDDSAWTIYGCIEKKQNFHIISKNPTLTPQQWQTNEKLLLDLGFNPKNFQNMTY